MAQFDVYRNPAGGGYLVDVQANLLDELTTRVVVPLIPISQFAKPAKRLNPIFTVGRQRCALVPQYLAAIPARELKSPIGTLTPRREDVIGAIDMVLSGV